MNKVVKLQGDRPRGSVMIQSSSGGNDYVSTPQHYKHEEDYPTKYERA